MPIQVDIKINGRLIHAIEVGRLDSLGSTEQVSDYLVQHFYAENLDEFVTVPPTVQHKYSDGALVLVGKAIEAMRRA